MVDTPPTWKDRAESYKRAETKWNRKASPDLALISEICRESSIPALEAGLLALVPLAQHNQLGGKEKDVLTLLFKQINTTKPSMKASIKKIFNYLAQTNAELLVQLSISPITGKNPKVASESLKVLVESPTEETLPYLFEHILPLAAYLFAHGTGSVREEATRLFQILAEKDPERVDEATQMLRPVQVKEIFQPRVVQATTASSAAATTTAASTSTNPTTTTASSTNPIPPQTTPTTTTSSTNSIPPQSNPTTTTTSQPNPIPPQPNSIPSQSKSTLASKPQKIIPLPNNFFERFTATDWKERLVSEELSDLLGDKGDKTLSPVDTVAVIDAALKRVTESNIKVFIAVLSVIRKCLSKSVPEGLVKELIKKMGKRLKDKKEQVYQAVGLVISRALEVYFVASFDEVVLLLKTEKSSRSRILPILITALDNVQESDISRSEVLPLIIECCNESSPETRNLAAAALALIFCKRGDPSSLAEIEALGVERMVAQKALARLDELFQQKEAEITQIVDSLCEEIRNTTITQDQAPSPAIPATPIKMHPANNNEIESSPLITRAQTPIGIASTPLNTTQYQTNSTPPNSSHPNHTIPPNSTHSNPILTHSNPILTQEALNNCPGPYNNSIPCTSILAFIESGYLIPVEITELVDRLGRDAMADIRIISILQHVGIPEGELKRVADKLATLTCADVQTKVQIEALRARIERALGERTLFEEKCARAALMEKLATGLAVSEEEILNVLTSLSRRSLILREDEARLVIQAAVQAEYRRIPEIMETIFPLSKTLSICTELATDMPGALSFLLSLVEKCQGLSYAPIEKSLAQPGFIALLERINTPTAWKILGLVKTGSVPPTASPCPKRFRAAQEDIDINGLLNDIIDQDTEKAKSSLERLDLATTDNLTSLIESASTLVNVLLLQLNDVLSSGVNTHPSTAVILRILKRVGASERFLAALDAGTLLSLTSDYIMIVTGQMPRGLPAPESIRKECGESLIKICTTGPCAAMFKIYMTLLSSRYKEEKVREVLVKLVWKHSKVSIGFLGDKKIVTSLIASLNTFYSTVKGEVTSDPLISKVLHLHLIEILKYYGEEFVRLFKVSGPVLTQIQSLAG
ncbi:hypothetical protein NEHOM01_1857 [Nematocida homosporus]|uniref:uncharacterized protein n=1 Tax=Nematocida homosporus TaxID=1912981 RepID=UPI0022208F2E|nr:uncharacterized protein NEHOM01_1857 [Nematocida homosporus]KAI5187005.1 hypothetical protein NEHOM01_1857 [Nematocida homosporus]